MADLTQTQACELLINLKDQAESAASALTGKIYALQRLSSVIELAGDALKLPDPAALVPYNTVDVSAYKMLAGMCPDLFPPLDPLNSQLFNLRAQLSQAYNALAKQLDDHPYSKLADLSHELGSEIGQLVNQINDAAQPALSKFECVTALGCEGSLLPQVPNALVTGVYDSVKRLGAAGASLLSTEQQDKVAALNTLKARVAQLQPSS